MRLPITSIRLDYSTIFKAQELGYKIPSKQLRTHKNTFQLSNEKLKNLRNINILPPIDVIQKEDKSYILLNGRHRVVLSLLKGDTHINAKCH